MQLYLKNTNKTLGERGIDRYLRRSTAEVVFAKKPMQIKQSNNENEHKDETKIISLAMTVSEIHLQGNDKKEVQVQGVKLKLNAKHFTLARQSTLV